MLKGILRKILKFSALDSNKCFRYSFLFFLKIYVFIWKTELDRNKGTSLVHSLNAWNDHSLVRPKGGVCNYILVLQVSHRCPAVFCCFLMHISRELDEKRKWNGRDWCTYGISESPLHHNAHVHSFCFLNIIYMWCNV